MIKPTSILNQFKEILITEEGAAAGEMVYVDAITDGTDTWKGWRYDNSSDKKTSFIGCLGSPPKKGFTWAGVKWKVEKTKDKPKHLKQKCNTITVHPGVAIMRFKSFILSGKV